MDRKLGLVFSGGGIRGLAHVGLLQVLEEYNIQPQIITGSSAGAIIGALYGAGYRGEDMVAFFENTPLFNFSFYSISKPGLMDSERYRVFFEKYFPRDTFNSLAVDLQVAVTDILEGDYKIFKEGKLIDPLIASAALPPLFSPVEIQGKLYSDGGIMNNFPVESIAEECHFIIGSFVNPIQETDKASLNNSAKLLYRAAELRFYAACKPKFEYCDYLFIPKALTEINILDTRKIREAYTIGLNAAKEVIGELIDALEMSNAIPESTSDNILESASSI